MSIRFSTEAANADVLGEDTPLEGQSGEAGGGGGSARMAERAARDRGRAAERDTGKPGMDINAPGFIKGPDASKPS